MRLFLPCRFFIGLSLLISCLIFRFVFTCILPSTGFLRSQSINGETSLSSDLRSMGQSESKELLLKTFQNKSLEHIQNKGGNESQNRFSDERKQTYPMILLSSNRSVKSDVQGNLGSPSVITSESISNWLTDRWQAASNMGGRPIPGPHWVEVDLGRLCIVEKIIIDWEDGYSNSWTLEGRASYNIEEPSIELGRSISATRLSRTHQHVIYELNLNDQYVKDQESAIPTKQSAQNLQDIANRHDNKPKSMFIKSSVRYVRLTIHSPATEWGSSIWRLQIWGYEVPDITVHHLI